MAKTRLNIEEDELRVNPEISTEETTKETTDEQDTGKNNDAPEATVSTGKKKVKIRAIEDIDCIIACKPYIIEKNKEVAVPVDVAAILCYGKKAYRL